MLDFGLKPGLPLIDPESLKSVGLKASLTNSATGITSDEGEKVEVQVIEIGTETLALEVSDQLCALGHHMLVKLTTVNSVKDFKFSSTARVTAFEAAAKGRARITLILLQYDKVTWSRILNLFSTRQREISESLRLMKGD